LGQVRPKGLRTEDDVTRFVVAIVSVGEPRASLVSALERAGASAEICTEATVVAKAAGFDAIVFDMGREAERFVVTAVALAADRMRWMPRVLLVDGETRAEQIARFGPAVILSSSATEPAILAAMADLVDQVRSRQSVDRGVRVENAALRAMEERLFALQHDGATLSHDARVLFGVILGYASNLRDGIAGPVTELQKGHAANIMEASTSASSLLDRHTVALRAIEREENADPLHPSQQPAARRSLIDLSEVVRGIVSLFEGIAEAKQIRLTAAVDTEVPSWCDAVQIKQALVNLLSNALKFTPAGGAVEVAARFVAHAGARRDVELVVSDTGPGIPLDQRARVFERGARLDRDRAIAGSGIGLAVVHDVIELHGGSVVIEEPSGGGASFVLSFPADLLSGVK
jgi:signal transduction histidine kinase